MKKLTYLVLFFTAGCATQKPLSPDIEKDYAIQAFFLEVPSDLLNELDLLYISKLVSESDSKRIMTNLCSDTQTTVTEFPVVYLNEGEKKKINNQHLVKFATAYSQSGIPLEFDTHGVGLMIEANVISVKNNVVELSYQIEDVDRPKWITYDLGTPPKKIKQPIFPTRSIEPTTELLPLNSFLFMSGLIKILDDETRLNLITAIQVKENNSQQ